MATGFSFGSSNTTAAPPFGSTVLSFAPPASQPQSTGLTFGSGTAGSTPSLFGQATAAPSTTTSLFGAAPTTSGLFGGTAATSAAPNLSFGAAPANTTLSFGATPVSSTGAPTLNFGAPLSTTAPPPSFSLSTGQIAGAPGFGLNATTTSATPTPSFGLGLSTNTAGGLKLGAQPATSAPTLNFGLGGTPATATTSASNPIGLGGIPPVNQAKSVTQKEVAPKEQALPNEISQTVNSFKDFVQKQKLYSSDIARCSVRDYRRIEQEIDLVRNQVSDIELELRRNRQFVENLKYDTAGLAQNVEMAQKTQDTPAGLQYENTEPLRFFINVAAQFERDMQNLKAQVEEANKYVKTTNYNVLNHEDLSIGLKRLHDTFVTLAGRLHMLHSQVESQKETYLNIRRHLFHDPTDPFQDVVYSQISKIRLHSPPKVATGPTPFNNISLRAISAETSQQHSSAPPSYPCTGTATGFGTITNVQLTSGPLFGSPTFGQSSETSLLQARPNKRGKV